MKASLQSGRAGDTAKHNDRTMYVDGRWPGEGPEHPLENYYWTRETQGVGTAEAEQRFYAEQYLPVIQRKIDAAVKNRNKAPYDLSTPIAVADSLEKFRKAHPPRETIIQIGDKNEQPGPAWSREMLVAYIEDVIVPEFERMKDMHLIGADVHMEEATPHAHLRWIGNGPDGLPNTEAALAANGFEPPVPYAEYAAEYLKKQQAKHAATGAPIKTIRESATRGNNRLMSFTAVQREQFESFAEARGVTLDTVRTRTPHLELDAFRAKKRREEAVKAEQQLIAEQVAEVEKIEQRVEQRRDSYKSVGEALKEAGAALDVADGGVAVDAQGREIDDAWVAEMRERVGGLSVRDSKKDRLGESLDVIDEALKARTKSASLDDREARLDAREARLGERETELVSARESLDAEREGWERDEKPKLVTAARKEGLESSKAEAEKLVTDARAKATAITTIATGDAQRIRDNAAAEAERVEQEAKDRASTYWRDEKSRMDGTLGREFERRKGELNDAFEAWPAKVAADRERVADEYAAEVRDILEAPRPDGSPSIMERTKDAAAKRVDARYGGVGAPKMPVSRAELLSETRDARLSRQRAARAATLDGVNQKIARTNEQAREHGQSDGMGMD